MKTSNIVRAKITMYAENSEKFERELLFTDWESLKAYIGRYWEITQLHEDSENYFIACFDTKYQGGKWENGYVHASLDVVIDYKTANNKG